MKIKILLSLLLAVLLDSLASANTVIVTNSGNTFTPDEITIELGDTVLFDITSYHNAVEVNQSTWDANGTTPNGGFDIDFGGGELVINSPGTYYYVCTPHASLGMKGIITVTSTVTSSEKGVAIESNSDDILNVYPNPVSDMMYLSFTLNKKSGINIDIVDITGRTAKNIIDAEYETGTYTVTISLAHLRPGRYFVLYRSEYENKVLPFLIIK
jgi:plastocyanin